MGLGIRGRTDLDGDPKTDRTPVKISNSITYTQVLWNYSIAQYSTDSYRTDSFISFAFTSRFLDL